MLLPTRPQRYCDPASHVLYLFLSSCIFPCHCFFRFMWSRLSQIGLWQHAAERQVAAIRRNFFSSILGQNISWFDLTPTGELSTRLTDDVLKIREGIGGKVGRLVQTIGQSIAGKMDRQVKD